MAINKYLSGAKVNFPTPFLLAGLAPLDIRQVVEKKSDLKIESFYNGDAPYWYPGMLVSCVEDSKVYILKEKVEVDETTQEEVKSYEFVEVTPDLPENAYKNTTYVIEESEENGNITITPSDGDAYDVPVHGLQDAAYTTVATLESTMDTKDATILTAAKNYADDNDSDTTYAFTEGDVNGEFVVTPSDGTAQQVKVHGLGSAAYTDADAYDEKGAADAALAAAKEYAAGLPHENTTYTFDDGTELGKFTVTPSLGTAQTVTVGGLGTAAGKSTEDFVSSVGYVAYSDEDKTKLEGIEVNAEKNIIETVKVNGAALTPDDDRAVNVVIPDAAVKGVKSGEKVLALDVANGLLSSSITLSYKSKSEEGGDGIIKLTGIDGADLGQIDASEFIKDGMIDTVAWSTETGKENYLVITWNTDAGKQKTEINFGKYVDTWTHRDAANGIKVENDKYVGVVDTASETFLTVGEAGFKLSGVQNAINAAVAAKNVSASGDTYVSATVADGTNHVTVAASETTKASLALADSALQAADIATGATNGTIAVGGVDVAVKGLGAAAYVGTTATPTENSTDAFTADGAYVLDGKIAANTAAIEEVKDEVSENAQVTAAAINDLNERLKETESNIADGVGVMSIEGEDPYNFESLPEEDKSLVQSYDDFVYVTANADDAGKVALDAQVVITKSTINAKALATDAYVQEIFSWASF